MYELAEAIDVEEGKGLKNMETPTEQLAASLAGLSLQPSPLSPSSNKAKLESMAGESAVNGGKDAAIESVILLPIDGVVLTASVICAAR